MTTRRGLALLAAAATFLLGVHILLLAAAAPRVRTLGVALPNWPARAAPLRVALLSDLHVASRGDTPARLAATVRLVNALRPDLVLIAGDFTGSGTRGAIETPPGNTVRLLGQLHPPLGVWAVPGNHDLPIGRLATGLKRIGAHLLTNQAARIGPLALLVVGDRFSGQADVPATLRAWAALPPGGVPVVLTHSPDIVPELPAAIQLVLAGHTHCGQVRLPLVGAPLTQSRYGQRYGCGVIREGGRLIVVGAGLGTSSLPVRLGAAPELWLLTLGG